MAEPGSYTSLKEYYNVRARDIEPAEVVKTFRGESDRSLVVVLASLLEDNLTEQIRDRLRPMERREEKDLRLYHPDGPIGSFSVKTNVAYAMQIIDATTRSDLQDLREMRNACAHSFKPINFSTPQLYSVMLRMFQPEREPLIIRPTEKTPHWKRRHLFMLQALSLMLIISHGGREEAKAFLREQARLETKARRIKRQIEEGADEEDDPYRDPEADRD